MLTTGPFAGDSALTICPLCNTNKLSGEDMAVNKYAFRILKVPCFDCRKRVINKFYEENSLKLVFPEYSHKEYLTLPYSDRK